MEAQKTRKGYCLKGHPLTMIFDRKEVPNYEANASCDKCECIIDLNHIYMVGFLHCEKCEYDICRNCAQGKVKEVVEEMVEIEESVQEGEEEWSVDVEPVNASLDNGDDYVDDIEEISSKASQ